MKYMGSKNRIAKYILPIMLENRGNRTWIEPFVGGGNIIDKVEDERIGADLNPNVIKALTIIRDQVHLLPKNNIEFTKQDYLNLNLNDDYQFKSFAGFTYAFGGKWLGVWARDKDDKRDYVNEAYRNALKQSPKLQNIKLVISNYFNLEIPPNSLIYCDPPYQGVNGYKCEKFNHERFWQWCRDQTNNNHLIFISEYNAPSDFECIWSKEFYSCVSRSKATKSIEKLFVYKG